MTYKVAVETIASGVPIGQDKGLLSLARSPHVLKQRSVPVNLVEDMGSVNKSRRAVTIRRPQHVVLVVTDFLRWVIAGWEVDVGTKRGSKAVAILVWEANTLASVGRILNTDAVKTIRVSWVQRLGFVGSGAGPLDWLRDAIGKIEDIQSSSSRWDAEIWVARDHSKTNREGLDLVIGTFEAAKKILA